MSNLVTRFWQNLQLCFHCQLLFRAFFCSYQSYISQVQQILTAYTLAATIDCKWEKNTLKSMGSLAKFQNFSILPWRPNLLNDIKSTRFLWVFIVLWRYITFFPTTYSVLASQCIENEAYNNSYIYVLQKLCSSSQLLLVFSRVFVLTTKSKVMN